MTRVNKAYLFFIIFTVIYFGSSFLLALVPNLYSLDMMVYNIIGQLVMFIPLIIICLAITKETPKSVLMTNRVSIMDILLSIALAIAIEPAMTLLSMLSTLVTPNVVSEYLYESAESPLIYSIIAVAVIPALFEELFFRGIIFSQLKNVSLKKACIIAGLLFGLGHFSFQQFLYAFAMGVLACAVVYRTKSIFPTMILHFTINFSQLMLSRVDYNEITDGMTNTLGSAAAAADISVSQMILPYVLLTAISIPIIALIIRFMGSKYGRASNKKCDLPMMIEECPVIADESVFDYKPEKEFEEKIFTAPFFVIIIVYLALTVITLLMI
ncbi:MAG: type II CAAX endopeptidase family protein [Candidatus Metalachnospira sp.]|nr:type II CAAX endopeptidase family protein [Candidatus Metalachnospira sp.]